MHKAKNWNQLNSFQTESNIFVNQYVKHNFSSFLFYKWPIAIEVTPIYCALQPIQLLIESNKILLTIFFKFVPIFKKNGKNILILYMKVYNNSNNETAAADENSQSEAEADDSDEEPDHQKVEVPLGGNVQLHCPKGKTLKFLRIFIKMLNYLCIRGLDTISEVQLSVLCSKIFIEFI